MVPRWRRRRSAWLSAVGDGAPWLAMQARQHIGAHGSYLFDLYHVCDFIAAVWPVAKDTVSNKRDQLKAVQLQSVLEALRTKLESPDTPEPEAPARAALRCLENRFVQLGYPSAPKHGQPVGSGLIESTHRRLLQACLNTLRCIVPPQHSGHVPTARPSCKRPLGKLLAKLTPRCVTPFILPLTPPGPIPEKIQFPISKLLKLTNMRDDWENAHT